jgi:hypothetical protein
MRGRYWHGWMWLVASGGTVVTIALAAVALQAGEPLKPPSLLADLLKVQPEWRLLDPATDLVGDYTVEQLEEHDRWPPWLEGDFDKDDRDDIAAVLVRRGAGGEPEFSVVAVHGKTRGRAEFVVPFGPRRIFGVSDEFKADALTPLHCIECHSNVWYRWNGRAYEPLLHAVGDSVQIAGEAGRRLTLFADPRPDASRTADVPICVRARVLQVGGREDERWYRVEVDAPSSPTGWVPHQLVVSESEEDCAG